MHFIQDQGYCACGPCVPGHYFFTTLKHYYYDILHFKVTNKSETYMIQALTWTHQSAEPLRWPSTCDPRRIHLDPHKVFHGPRFWLAGVMLPHRALVRAHQGFAQFVLAQSGGQAAQQQQQHSLKEHGRLGGYLERGPAQGEGATELRGQVTSMEQ